MEASGRENLIGLLKLGSQGPIVASWVVLVNTISVKTVAGEIG